MLRLRLMLRLGLRRLRLPDSRADRYTVAVAPRAHLCIDVDHLNILEMSVL